MTQEAPPSPFSYPFERPDVRPASIGGFDGVLIEGRQAPPTYRQGGFEAALLLFADGEGLPRIAGAARRPGSWPGAWDAARAVGDDMARAAISPVDESRIGHFLGQGQHGSMPRAGSRHALAAVRAARSRARAAVREAIRASDLPDHIGKACDVLADWPLHLGLPATLAMMHPAAAALRDAAAADPFGVMATLGDRGVGADGAVVPPEFTPSLARRFAQIGAGSIPDDATEADLRLLAGLAARVPIDWVPADGSPIALGAMLDAARACAPAIAQGFDPAVLVRSAAGDWPAFRDRCAKAAAALAPGVRDGTGIAKVVAWGLSDAATALARAVLLPLAIRSGVRPDPAEPLREVLPAARAILFAGKALPACLEVSGKWHAGMAAISAAMPSDRDDRSWPALHPAYSVGPYDVVPLTSALDLMEEGGKGPDRNGVPGMDHCVGGVGYRSDGAARESHFISIRLREPGDGRPYARVATAEMRFVNGVLVERQVQGPGNATVPREVAGLVKAYMRIPVDPVEPLPRDASGDAVREQVGYDHTDDALLERVIGIWQPYLPREWRRLGIEAFAVKAGFPMVVSQFGSLNHSRR